VGLLDTLGGTCYDGNVKNESVFQFTPGSKDELVDRLTQAGYSNTRARRAVLEALSAADGPVTPTELLDSGRRRHEALGLVTVYRTLEILESLGLVRKLHLAEGCHSYVLSTVGCASGSPDQGREDGHGHHIICQKCHRAVEFAGCDIEPVIRAVQAQTGFAVQSHLLEIFGLCPACQEQEA
jgi:Fur family transcriptional regulator, ferric uptake regulator